MKLFSGGPPNSPRFVDDLRLVVDLEDTKRKDFARWFEDIPNLYPSTLSELAPFAATLKIGLDDLNRLIGLARFVLSAMDTLELSEDDLHADFAEGGFSEPDISVLSQFFHSLLGSSDKVRRAVLKRAYEQLALPTIDDINVVWDIRPIFEDVAYTLGPKGDEYESLIGKVYVLLLEISASRTDGMQESKTYQLSEEEFERFVLALQRVKRQLEIVKQKVM